MQSFIFRFVFINVYISKIVCSILSTFIVLVVLSLNCIFYLPLFEMYRLGGIHVRSREHSIVEYIRNTVIVMFLVLY